MAERVATSDMSSPRKMWQHWRRNVVRQLKLIIPGASITLYLGTVNKILGILHSGSGSWQSTIALAAISNAATMIALFLYMLFLIYYRDEHPDWRSWRQSGSMSTIIPVLTATIILGWLLHFVALGRWSELGYFRGFVGASALYALIFGVLALVPAPRKEKDKQPISRHRR
ncbi:hypothetical protein AGABI1DRAFT_114362 [Agaricus bisporus var. burnettii JB137-S8]|uniref:Uncharacterized protein n=1 Tax=Agaricus bisporus var. burnettii (strain JB137-S8 / ATCC MYA-4627 / FGSC 10392) TaxID=597362 RepID=K5XUJ2_AGABU|nr:uncharacterized protein AGABI1DRAFT_114362 [Agaricus bisporus var. burnettii JB137-S8]EKM78765.1 hypothetical protein AGABI1DRAFT_114362 [Agaricus bisporus var. burnettii JB137-S8]